MFSHIAIGPASLQEVLRVFWVQLNSAVVVCDGPVIFSLEGVSYASADIGVSTQRDQRRDEEESKKCRHHVHHVVTFPLCPTVRFDRSQTVVCCRERPRTDPRLPRSPLCNLRFGPARAMPLAIFCRRRS